MQAKTLDIYLEDGLRESAERGEHNYFNKIREAFESKSFQVRFRPNGPLERAGAALRPGYSLYHMDAPTHSRALTTRRAYFYPFWRIETSGKRWEWDVAQATFDAESVDGDAAQPFFTAWAKRLYGPAPASAKREGYIYMPLQGLLTEQRSFQSMSPIAMIEATRKADPKRPIFATLHPGESYSMEERRALDRLIARLPALQVSKAPMEELLAGADYVVTQNSAAALSGFFFRKPAVLFAHSDFHHIAEPVSALGVEEAFRRVQNPVRAYARYLYWFLQLQSINAGKPDAPEQILNTVRARGWTV